MCSDQLLWTGWILITRCCYFKASVSLGLTAKPAEDLSAAGNECPPGGCPAQAAGRRNLAPWLAFHPPLLVVTCASMPVIESLTQLFSRYGPSSLTSHPQGYIKICSPEGSWKWDTPQPLIPLIHPHVHIKTVMVYTGGGAVLWEGVQTFRAQELSKAANFPHAGGVRSEQQEQCAEPVKSH